jgi:serine/threonine-protein kinase
VNDPFLSQLQEALAANYVIDRELTGGGMSRVFVAVEKALGRRVVVKVLKPDLAAGVNRERFRREIMLAAQLHHPHIVPVLSAGEHGDLLWYTMPFVEGESLRAALVNGQRFNSRDVGRVMHDVLDALAYAHERGVIHRDIKPGNILRHRSHSLVTDFGVAKALSASMPYSGTTSVGMAIGTPAYMAPEQLAADPNADHRMDLYAVGLLAYELLSGAQPFSGHSPQETLAAQLTRMPAPIEESSPETAPELAALVMNLLAKDPNARPPTALAALEQLEAFTTPSATASTTAAIAPNVLTRPSRASGQTSGSEPAPRSSRRGLIAGGVGVVVLALGAFLARGLVRPARGVAEAPAVARAPDSATARKSTPPAARLTREDSIRIANAVRPPARKTASESTAVGATGTKQSGRVAGRDSGKVASSTSGPAAPPKPKPAAAARPAPKALVSAAGTPLRVAVLPVRDGTPRSEFGTTAKALEDSLRHALATAGYSLASDAELLRLLTQNDPSAQRRLAEGTGIGAIVTGMLTLRADEVVAQAMVLDVWRGSIFSEREASDSDKPLETLGVVRDVGRALERVSWRTRNDPRRVIFFDLDNPTGIDSLSDIARQLGDAVRGMLLKRSIQVVSDSQARATKDVNERRAVATRLGVGASIAGTVYRVRADSVYLRFSTRDQSEERNLPTIELRVPRGELLGALQTIVERLLSDLSQVNWGPKGLPPNS